MNDILNDIIANKEVEVADLKRTRPLLEPSAKAVRRSMKQALANSSTGIIAEFKRRSPSKGWIKQEADPADIPIAYQRAGAAALSILTDQKFFGGSLSDIRAARPLVSIPILRKDFIIDEYQLIEATIADADAVLLIAAALSPQQCADLAAKAHELGLETLLEVHSADELAYVGDDIDMVGVNNRNLGTFHTDVTNSYALAKLLPADKLLVSESGISVSATVRELRSHGFKGFLIGETFMKTPSPAETLQNFLSKL